MESKTLLSSGDADSNDMRGAGGRGKLTLKEAIEKYFECQYAMPSVIYSRSFGRRLFNLRIV